MPTRSPSAKPADGPARRRPPWTFLTNHGHVLVCIADNPDVRIAEIADLVGIGERAAHRIVCDLVQNGYVERRKDGRRNRYAVDFDRPLRHPLESGHTIGAIFRVLAGPRRRGR
jgi:hypothetical protein